MYHQLCATSLGVVMIWSTFQPNLAKWRLRRLRANQGTATPGTGRAVACFAPSFSLAHRGPCTPCQVVPKSRYKYQTKRRQVSWISGYVAQRLILGIQINKWLARDVTCPYWLALLVLVLPEKKQNKPWCANACCKRYAFRSKVTTMADGLMSVQATYNV